MAFNLPLSTAPLSRQRNAGDKIAVPLWEVSSVFTPEFKDAWNAAGELEFELGPAMSLVKTDVLKRLDKTGYEVTVEEAKEMVELAGLAGHLNFPTRTPWATVSFLIDEKIRELKLHDRIDQYKGGVFGESLIFGAYFIQAMMDPLNVAAGFIPVVGQARYAAWANRFGKVKARAARGGVQGIIGTAAVEPFILEATHRSQADYGFANSAINIAFGATFTAGLHVGVGAASDLISRLRPGTRESVMRSAVAQLADGRQVDVEIYGTVDAGIRDFANANLPTLPDALRYKNIEAFNETTGKKVEAHIYDPHLYPDGKAPKSIKPGEDSAVGTSTGDNNSINVEVAVYSGKSRDLTRPHAPIDADRRLFLKRGIGGLMSLIINPNLAALIEPGIDIHVPLGTDLKQAKRTLSAFEQLFPDMAPAMVKFKEHALAPYEVGHEDLHQYFGYLPKAWEYLNTPEFNKRKLEWWTAFHDAEPVVRTIFFGAEGKVPDPPEQVSFDDFNDWRAGEGMLAAADKIIKEHPNQMFPEFLEDFARWPHAERGLRVHLTKEKVKEKLGVDDETATDIVNTLEEKLETGPQIISQIQDIEAYVPSGDRIPGATIEYNIHAPEQFDLHKGPILEEDIVAKGTEILDIFETLQFNREQHGPPTSVRAHPTYEPDHHDIFLDRAIADFKADRHGDIERIARTLISLGFKDRMLLRPDYGFEKIVFIIESDVTGLQPRKVFKIINPLVADHMDKLQSLKNKDSRLLGQMALVPGGFRFGIPEDILAAVYASGVIGRSGKGAGTSRDMLFSINKEVIPLSMIVKRRTGVTGLTEETMFQIGRGMEEKPFPKWGSMDPAAKGGIWDMLWTPTERNALEGEMIEVKALFLRAAEAGYEIHDQKIDNFGYDPKTGLIVAVDEGSVVPIPDTAQFYERNHELLDQDSLAALHREYDEHQMILTKIADEQLGKDADRMLLPRSVLQLIGIPLPPHMNDAIHITKALEMVNEKLRIEAENQLAILTAEMKAKGIQTIEVSEMMKIDADLQKKLNESNEIRKLFNCLNTFSSNG